jgi:heme A synthase
MKNPWLHRGAILLAVLALIVITLGASLTSEIRPLPGAGNAATVSAPSLEQAHRLAGYALAVLTLGLAIGASNLPGWLALAAVIGESVSGGASIVHAMLAPVLFALLAATAVVTSKEWQVGPKPAESAWPRLRPIGFAVPVLVVMQIGLGAAFRHNAMGVISHIMNAMIVLLVILVAGVFVVRQHPEHPALRPAALALLIVTGVQVLLGFAVYLILLMSSENNPGLIVVAVMHVANGALTLAASLVFAMQMQRNLRWNRIQLSEP